MKQSLHLKLGQQLAMTPQLQQAIRLLQMSTLDLQQEIQQALESNMMLEINEDESIGELNTRDKKAENTDLVTSEGSQTDIPDELPVDSSWDDIYDNTFEANSSSSNNDDGNDYEVLRSKSSTLLDHLLWQLELTSFSERDHAIAMSIIDSINDDGYLISSPKDIFEGLLSQLDDLELDEVMAVLHGVQNFDPAGVAAIDLADCLHIQLQQLPESTPYRHEALIIVSEHLDMLASHEQTKLMRKLDITERQLDGVVALIRTLDPKPGAQIQIRTLNM